MPLTTSRSATGWILPLLIAACHAAGPESTGVAPEGAERERLPTGRLLDPAVPSMLLSGSFPLSAALSPDSGRVAVLLSGYSRQGIEIVDLRRRRVTQTLEQPAAFVGLAAAPDGRTLYASGGNQDVVYRYAWDSAGATLRDSLALGPSLWANRAPGIPPAWGSRRTDASSM